MFTKKEIALIRKLNTPAKVQDFLNSIPFNFEKKGETLKSPERVLRTKSAHCFEGALLGAYILSLHGFKPLVLHLQSTEADYDHVITPFQVYGLWGALSRTNHAVLRYREPIYKNIHELVMSYFHEYFLKSGVKTLRRYSDPMDLNIFGTDWVHEEHDLWYIDKKLDKVKHHNILTSKAIKNLRKADKIEIKAGEIREY
ncbi:MAG: hypothetical protein KBC06_02260 [Candidatus Pacebacteria bacterium]|nr:hypothetical protein [Candidatus Paceibacterota bacterium]